MDAIDNILAQWARERPDLDVGPMGLIGRLRRLARRLGDEMERTFEAHGLTAAGFDLLATLRRSGAPYRLTPGALQDSMMITSGTVTHRIDLLVKAGLVTRTPNPDDRRSMVVGLTDQGTRVIDAALADHVATQARLCAALSADDQVMLDGLLRRFQAGLD